MDQRPPKRYPAVGTTAGNRAPSWKAAASSLRVEERGANGAPCLANAVTSSYRVRDRVVVRSSNGCALVEELKGTATRMNASIACCMVILVIALTVG